MEELDTGRPSTASPVLRQQSFHAAQTRASHLGQASQPGAGLGRTVSAPSRAPQAASNVDAKLREVILAEVLDTRPSVRWEDVAACARPSSMFSGPGVT